MSTADRLQHRLQQRLQQLHACYTEVAGSRMRGLPVLHPGLQVQTLGFVVQPEAGDGRPRWAEGVLITPWCMNLLRLPLAVLPLRDALAAGWLAPGMTGQRQIGSRLLDFIGTAEPLPSPTACHTPVGDSVFEACSLFSPMFQFAHQAAAQATAAEVLRLLRQPEPLPPRPVSPPTSVAAPPPPSPQPQPQPLPPPPPRRGFLFGGLSRAASR